jgi:hypothetical protein
MIMMNIDEINFKLAAISEELHAKWMNSMVPMGLDVGEARPEEDNLRDQRDEMFLVFEEKMPIVGQLIEARTTLAEQYKDDSLWGLATRLNWSEAEYEHAKVAASMMADEYGDECVIVTHSGREIRSPSFPSPADYLRITQHGFELGYWSSDEWKDAPEEVISAIIGALKNDCEPSESEDLTSTFDASRNYQRQGHLV